MVDESTTGRGRPRPPLAAPFSRQSLVRGTYSPGMDRIWQWAWDRYGARYSWALCAITFPTLLTYLFWSLVIVAVEKSDRYFEVAGITVVAVLVLSYAMVLPGWERLRPIEQWAAGHQVDRKKALEATYAYARVGLTRDGGHLTGGTAGPAGRMSVCRASVGSTPRSSGSRLPAW